MSDLVLTEGFVLAGVICNRFVALARSVATLVGASSASRNKKIVCMNSNKFSK